MRPVDVRLGPQGDVAESLYRGRDGRRLTYHQLGVTDIELKRDISTGCTFKIFRPARWGRRNKFHIRNFTQYYMPQFSAKERERERHIIVDRCPTNLESLC